MIRWVKTQGIFPMKRWSTHKLFGSELYKKLNTKETYDDESEEEVVSEFDYLKILTDLEMMIKIFLIRYEDCQRNHAQQLRGQDLIH